MLDLTVHSLNTETRLGFAPRALVIAGWAGRDRDAMEHHIRELEALGVARPATTPTYYRVSAARLTTSETMEASGEQSSGEVEPLILAHDGRLYVGVGSDHTDRKVETYGVAVSKQMCDKPIAAAVWPFEEVADHWDELVLRSFIRENGNRVAYQEGKVSALLDPRDTIAGLDGGKPLADGTAMLCGTLPAIGGIRPSPRFEAELEDPVLGRTLSFAYEIEALPIAG